MITFKVERKNQKRGVETMRGCSKITLKKIVKAWQDIRFKKEIGPRLFLTDDEFQIVLLRAEKSFHLNAKEQDNETFYSDAKRLLQDEIARDNRYN